MVEILVVAVLVIWSVIVVFKKVFPQTASSVFMSLSRFCENKDWNRLAKWLRPAVVSGCGGGCDCSSANEIQGSKKVETQAVKWK